MKKTLPLTTNELPARGTFGHCPIDPLHETCEKFFQIWSHKAANISSDLIEYTIRRMQSDRLKYLFQTRNEFTHKENVLPICQMSIHIEDDLRGIKEQIRRFCLSTRNVYRHLRSDSRIYPQMSIELDQNIMIKICRFIFKTKVLIKVLSKQQHLNADEREQIKTNKQLQINDPYKNITKAFIVLQSNFEILFGNILDRDFFQNAKSAVQTLPIVLDISKTIRLIFCALYKLSEPERQAEADAIRQRRLAFCVHGYGTKKPRLITKKTTTKNEQKTNVKTINEIPKISQSQLTPIPISTPVPSKTLTVPTKTVSSHKSINQPKTKSSSKRLHPSKSHSHTSNRKTSKTKTNHLSPSMSKRSHVSSKKSSTTAHKKQPKAKTPNSKHKIQKTSHSKNKNALTTDSSSSNKSTEKNISINNNYTTEKFDNINSDKEKFRWTTWLHNATVSLANIQLANQNQINSSSFKPFLTTWASLERIYKS